MTGAFVSPAPQQTFELGERLGKSLRPGDVVLLHGGLGAGKTLFTKGIMNGLEFHVDEVTSPSFALVNLYKTGLLDVYHIDLWRLAVGPEAAFAVGLEDIIADENAVVIIEWAERLGYFSFRQRTFGVNIEGDGDGARTISIDTREQSSDFGV